jgi:hypothetical protein
MGEQMVESYVAVRTELRTVVGPELSAELDRIVPDRTFGGDEVWQDNFDFTNAKLVLSRLAGWLDGLIEEAQYASRLEAEAAAYADARVSHERRVGFQPPSTQPD